MRTPSCLLAIAVTLCVSTTSELLGQDTPTDAQKFEKIHSAYAAIPQEAWRRIPWQSELLAAQRDAARRKMPIFIWAMDGNPLGCT